MNKQDEKFEQEIRTALIPVIDPELGISIIDLGLLYGIDYNDVTSSVVLNLTLTTPTCPLTDQIEAQAKQALAGIVKDVEINWVWNPPWTTDMITEEGKKQLNAIGFNF